MFASDRQVWILAVVLLLVGVMVAYPEAFADAVDGVVSGIGGIAE